MADDNLVMRAKITLKHREELDVLREMLDEALIADDSSETLLTVKLWAESLVAIHALERQAFGFR